MPTSKRKDFTQVALAVVRQATGEVPVLAPSKKAESGRKGGLVGGAARAIKITPQRRREIAVKAAAARWTKDKGATRPVEEPDPAESSRK